MDAIHPRVHGTPTSSNIEGRAVVVYSSLTMVRVVLLTLYPLQRFWIFTTDLRSRKRSENPCIEPGTPTDEFGFGDNFRRKLVRAAFAAS